MGNMIYCRFQNTLRDLRDCDGALSVILDLDEELSNAEARSAKALIRLCQDIANEYGEGVDD